MNLRSIVTSVVSVFAGVGLGYLLFHHEREPVVGTASDAVTTRPAPRASAPPPSTAPTPTSGPTPPSSPPPSAQPAAPSPPELAPQVIKLEQRVQELEQQLAIERAIRRGTEGEAISPPPNLPARFRDEKLLLTTFNEALQKAGFAGQVTNIDCTEHPCLVFGTGFGERGDMEKLKSELGPYEHDSFSTYGFGSKDGKKEHRFFGVAVMPELKGPPDEATQKRTTFRVNQMYEASKPPPSPSP